MATPAVPRRLFQINVSARPIGVNVSPCIAKPEKRPPCLKYRKEEMSNIEKRSNVPTGLWSTKKNDSTSSDLNSAKLVKCANQSFLILSDINIRVHQQLQLVLTPISFTRSERLQKVVACMTIFAIVFRPTAWTRFNNILSRLSFRNRVVDSEWNESVPNGNWQLSVLWRLCVSAHL